MSFFEFVAKQRMIVNGQSLLRATKVGSCGKPWWPISWKDLEHKRRGPML